MGRGQGEGRCCFQLGRRHCKEVLVRDATLDWLFYRPTKRGVLATQASVRTPGNVGMFPYDRCQAFNQLRERCSQNAGGTDPSLPEQGLAVRAQLVKPFAAATDAHYSHTALPVQRPAYKRSPPRALLGNVNGGAGYQRHTQQRHPTTGCSQLFQRPVGALPGMVADMIRRVFTPSQPRVPRMVAAVHTRTSRKGVADTAHLGMNRSFLDIERFRRLAEIKMNRIVAAILLRPLFGWWQHIIRGALKTGHEHGAADALQR